MQLSIAEVRDSLVMVTERFFETEQPSDFEVLLQHYNVVESLSVQHLVTELTLIHGKLGTLPNKVRGHYPATLSKQFGLVSMVGLVESKLTVMAQYRETLKRLLQNWVGSPNSIRALIEERIEKLTAVVQNDQNVASKLGNTRNEDTFLQLLKSRKQDPYVNFTFELTSFNKTPLECAVASFKNVSSIPLRFDVTVKSPEPLMENLAVCLERLAKKQTLCVYSLRVIREFLMAAEECV